MASKKNKLAIFDIDGTIFRSSLVIELSHALVDAKIFPGVARKEIAKEYLAWLDRKGTYEAYINQVVKIYVKHITGKNFKLVDRVAKQVILYQKDRTYRFTRDLIKKLKRQGYILAAVSGSPSYIVEEYAKTIGFNVFFGTELEVVGGKFTGKVKNLDSAFNKAKIVKNLSLEYNADLKQSVAVGDTEGDVKMLSLVGHPLAFNPNLQLAKIAKKKHWQIVVERKDVAYDIKNFSILV
ncbi:MAG: HAD family phosphatase [Candidatus Doudnabacteria bacterium]|jgi:HAD superfamily hydrolase (TIGR01490 family)